MHRSSKVTVFFLVLGIVAVVARAASVTISNASFETATLSLAGPGSYSNLIVGSTIAPTGGSLANWTAASTSNDAAAGGFAPSIGGSNWTSKWWSGSTIAYLETSSAGVVSLSQALSAVLQNDTTYTLSAQVGNRIFASRFNYSLQLWAGSTLLSSASNLALAKNTSGTDRLVFSSGASNPAAGQTLTIVLSSTGVAGTFSDAFFDDISLTAAPSSVTTLVSSPSSAAQLGQTVILTATVSPASATGTVTFYDSETVLGTGTLAGGQASLSTSLLRSGQRSLRAYYSGDVAKAPSSSTLSVFTVNATAVASFAPTAPYTTLQGPSDLTVGDFNADGKADLAVADYSANKVSILLGAGNGTFASHVDYDAGSQPVGIATGDFNGDGKTDLVIADVGGSSLRLLFGTGTGAFASPADLSVGSNPQGVAVGDFNRDGKADIVAANSGSNSATVLIGNGDGTFQTGIPYGSGGSGPRGVAIGDFNNDGIPDLAVANNVAGTVGILLGFGNGAFQSATTFNAGNPFYLAVADMNGDGKEDVIASNLNLSPISGNTVSVLMSNGNGTFQPYQSYSTGLSSTGIRGLTVGDFNGDGHPDVVLANWQATVASLMINNGSGTLGNPTNVTVGNGPADVVTGDFNGDGLPDIAAALFNSGGGSSVSVALGRMPPPADLVPQNVTLSATPLLPGASFTVNWTLANIGTAAPDATSTTVVRINQSTTSAAGTDLAGIATPALAAGTSVAQNTSVAAPLTPGTYYVWVIADRFGTANQNTLNDAQRSGPLTVTIAPSTLNLSRDLVALGIASQNLTPNQSSLDAGPLLQNGVAYAKNHGISTVIADPGAYYFLSVHDNTHVALGSGLNNMTIDFHGADLIFTHPLYYGIIVYPSTNVVLQNFSADYQPLPFTQIRVVAVDVGNSRIQYSVEPGWPDPSTFNSLTGPGGSGASVELHFFRSGRPILGRMYTDRPFTGNSLVVNSTNLQPLPAVRVGDVAAVALRSFADTINLNHCTSCTLRSITVYSSVAFGVLTSSSPSVVMERVYVIPKPGTGRLVSAFVGMGIEVTGPNNQIRLSRSIRSMDDGFAFGGLVVGTVKNQTGIRSLTVDASNGPTVLGNGDSVPNSTPVTFQRASDGAILGSAVIVSQSAATGSPPQVNFNFDRDLPGNLVAASMYSTDANQNGANSVIERSTVQSQSAARGLNIAALASSAVRKNYIRRSAFSGIAALQGMTPGEPPVPPLVNLNIANNVLDGTNEKSDWWYFEFGGIQSDTLTGQYDLMAGSPFSNINVMNNFIEDSGRSGVWLGNTAGGSMNDNYILNANTRPDVANAYQTKIADAIVPLVVDTTSSGVTVANNVIDNTSGRMFVTDSQYRELAAYAPGATIRLNAYNLGTLVNPSVTLTDADGKATSLVIQNTTPQAVDVQLTASAGLGGAFVTLASGGAKYFGTLFIDTQDNIPAVNGCTYESNAATMSVPNAGGGIPILVITQAGCPYQVVDSDSFVTIGPGGSETAVISVSFSANNAAPRGTTIEIAGQPLILTQDSVVAPVSVIPAFGLGASQTFSAHYSDLNGFTDITTTMLNVNAYSTLVHGCVAEYVRASNQMFLMNDAGTAWVGPGTPGAAGTLQNNQCRLDLQASSTASGGMNLTVNYALSFWPSFSGPKTVFLNASNVSLSSGWQAKSSWTVALKRARGQLISQ